ncbi:MAG TPA: ADP-ribosyl-[dinitrogen reductase] hydrolase [Geopsychrobacteraceae bacterium]
MDNPDQYARASAAFLGLALGDALGATTEFMTPAEIRGRYKVHRKMRGGGWLGVKPGQVTDDTEMSLALARALLPNGQWDLTQIADNFVGWMKSRPIDIGATVRKGIRLYLQRGELEVPYNEWDAGNGAVMRMAPVALFTLGDERALARCALQQARLTHNHRLSDAACLCVGRMVQAAILGADRFALHALTRELVAEYPTFRFNDYKGLATGYVVDTLQTVFHYLFTTGSFEECLVGVVNQGGDADTTGAIAGMIAGAFYGPRQLPGRWLKKLDKRIKTEIEEIAPQLVSRSPWAAAQPNRADQDRHQGVLRWERRSHYCRPSAPRNG